MASIQRLTSKLTAEVTYRAQVRVKGRPSESATFPNRKEAQTWAASVESAIREGKHFPHAAAKRTDFDALCADYEATVLPEFDAKENGTRVRHLKWWAEEFAGLSLAEITADRVSRGRDKLAGQPYTRGKERTNKRTGVTTVPRPYKRTGATVNRYIATLSHLLSFAGKERRIIDRNPVGDIARKKETRGRTRFLTDDERTNLLAACAKSAWPPLHTLTLLALTTGARKGELITLRWADVDLKAGRALVRETKNDEQRTLPLAGKALESLRELKLRNSARSAYVFAQPSGLPGPYVYFDQHWYAALKAAELEDFHFHDLRHTTASMLAAQGASLLEIADVLGHKTLAMVKRYSHLIVGHKAKVIDKLIAANGL